MSEQAIALNTAQGLTVWVPASLRCITTYVLLEQEAWFEYEIDFIVDWLRPGMTAMDVGASYGLYAMPMARKVGPSGKVLAFEPGRRTRALLERSRDDNGLEQLIVSPLALSDRPGPRTLFHQPTSEFDTLGAGSGGAVSEEAVEASSLDALWAEAAWDRLDFIKIDAEGEEGAILAGGAKTLAAQSPLIMLELAHNEKFQLELPEALTAMGYGLYRLTGDRRMLVPWKLGDLDAFSLNIFAAKPDMAARLAAEGRLAGQAAEPAVEGAPFAATWAALRALPYSQAYGTGPEDANDAYLSAIAGYFFWKDEANPPDQRFGALWRAVSQLEELCTEAPTVGRLSTLARAAFEGGWRSEAVTALKHLVAIGQSQPLPKDEPFIVANPRFDAIAPGEAAQAWFPAATLEQLQLISHHSSSWQEDHGRILRWLCHSPFAHPQIVRRLLLRAVIDGETDIDTLNWVRGDYPHLNREVLEGGSLLGLMNLDRGAEN